MRLILFKFAMHSDMDFCCYLTVTFKFLQDLILKAHQTDRPECNSYWIYWQSSQSMPFATSTT